MIHKGINNKKQHHHGGDICQSNGMATVFMATLSWQHLCDGLAKGTDEGFYLIMNISRKLN
jgi:hypothetical protein